MCETVEYLCAAAEFLDRQTVIFLIQEKSGLLPVFHIHDIFYAIFHDLNIGIKRLPDKSFDALHSLFFTLFRVTALIDAADLYPVF